MNFDNIINTQLTEIPNILDSYIGFIYSNTVASNYLSTKLGGLVNSNVNISGKLGIGTTTISACNLYISDNLNTAILGKVGIGTTDTSTYSLNVMNGDVSIGSNIIINGNLNQTASSQSNIFMGRVGIGTSTNITCNLTIFGNSYFNGRIGIGGTDFNSNLTVTGNSYFNGNIGIGTTNTSTYRLNIASGDARIASNINIEGSILQTSASRSNIFTGNVGIGGTTFNSNLTVTGPSYFIGNVGIGTNDTSTYKLNIRGDANINNGKIFADASGLNNLNLENQTLITIPPISLVSNTLTLLNNQNQNGNYVTSASSNSTNAYLAFDGNSNNEFTINGRYNASGNYTTLTSSIYITPQRYINDFNTTTSKYDGEWIQIYYDKGFVATSFTITGLSANNLKCPKDFILVGSLSNNSDWNLLSSQVGVGPYTGTDNKKTFTIANFTSYNYYRLVVSKTIGSADLSIAELSFSGYANPTYTNIDTINRIFYNTSEKRFPPISHSIIPNSLDCNVDYLSSNEILNITPTSYYKQKISIPEHGQYHIYSSSSNLENPIICSKSFLFDNTLSTDTIWGKFNYTRDGILTFQSSTYKIGNDNYFGDWIIIKFPYSIVLTKFKFIINTVNAKLAPALWKSYGSTNGITWTEITDASNSTTSATYIIDGSKNIYEKILPPLFDIPYLYLGWVFNKIIGGDDNATSLLMNEFEIYGKDDISSTYLNVWNKSSTNIYNTIGNVGIGTTNPTKTLSVIGEVYISSNVGIGGTSFNSNLAVTGNSYFNGNVGIGTTNTSPYRLNIAAGDVRIASNLNVEGSIFQTTASRSNVFMGNVGIGTSTNINCNLTIVGNSYFNGRVGIGGTDFNSNLAITGNSYFNGNIGIGTTNSSDHRLNVVGGDVRIASNIFIEGSLLQTSASRSNVLMGNVGIGTSTNINCNLTIVGNSYFNGRVGIGGTDFNSNLAITGNSYFNGNIGIGTTNSSAHRLNVVGGDVRIASNIIIEGSLLQTSASRSNVLMGNVGIGTSTNINCNLTIVGNSYFNGRVGIGGTDFNSNLAITGNSYFNGNIGIGTTDTTTYRLNIGGTLNASNIFQAGQNISTIYATLTDLSGVLSGNTNFSGNIGIGTTNSGTYRLNIVGGDARIASNINVEGSLLQTSASRSNVLMGNVGIGTSGNLNCNLTVVGNSYFNGRMGIGGTDFNSNFAVAGNSYFNGNIGLGTTDTTTYRLNVVGGDARIASNINVEGSLLQTSVSRSNVLMGNVGIGTSTNLNCNLTVVGNSYFNGRMGIGGTDFNSNFAVTGNSYFNGNIGLGTTDTTTYRLNVVGGDARIASNINVEGSLLQTSASRSNVLMGNVGIGTSGNLNCNLTVVGNSYFNGRMGIGGTDFNSNLAVTGNSYFNGNIGLGTTDTTTYRLNVVGGDARIASNIFIEGSLLQISASRSNVLMGNVGIGTSANLNCNLTVVGNSYFNGRMGIGGTDFNSNLAVTGNSYFNGNIGIGTTNSSAHRLNVVGGDARIASNIFIEGSLLQTSASRSNSFIGNVGIGTSTNLNCNLTVVGNSYFNGRMGIGGTDFNSNLAVTGNSYFNGNIGIGTTDTSTYRLNVVGGDTRIASNIFIEGSLLQTSASRSNVLMGNVGIGTSTNLNCNLTVVGNSYFNGRIGIGGTDFNSNLAVTGNSYFNGNIGIGTTDSSTYRLNVVGGDARIASNIFIEGSLLQTSASRSNAFMGNVGIGTSTNLNCNLTVTGNSYFNGRIGIGGTDFNSNLAVTGNSYFNGNIGIGTTNSGTYRLNVVGGDVRIASNIFIEGSLLQISASRSNVFMGNVGIGTSTNLNCNLTVVGNSYFNGRMGIGGTDFNSNLAVTGNSYFNGNIGIGTTDTSTYKINVGGTINATNIFQAGQNISDIYATKASLSEAASGDGSGLNNLKLDNNQSILSYPPDVFAQSDNNTKTITNKGVQNGTYIISSSVLNDTNLYLAFDGNTATSYIGGSKYSSGIPTAAPVVITKIDGLTYPGEYIELYYNKGFAAKSITIVGNSTPNTAQNPKNFILVGGINNSNWNMLLTVSNVTTYSPSNTYAISNNTAYNYYRLIVIETNGATSLSVINISFTGVANTSYTSQDTFNNIIYNTNEKQFPPKIWDIAPVVEELSSNDIFNIVPTSYYRQTFSINNHGTYTIFSSSTFNTNLINSKSSLFNFELSGLSDGESAAKWSQSYSAGNLISPGSAHTIGLNNTYFGNWIIIEFPFQIILTRFRFYIAASLVDRSPGFWRCYGSNDGINWIEITDASNVNNLNLKATYTALDGSRYYYEKVLPLFFDIPYLYIGWVVNSLAGSAVILTFAELQIFGKDDISNSYLNVWNKVSRNIYNTLGNVGIGTTNPTQALDVNGTIKATAFSGDGSLVTNVTASSISTVVPISKGGTNSSTGYTDLGILYYDSSSQSFKTYIGIEFELDAGTGIPGGGTNRGPPIGLIFKSNYPLTINSSINLSSITNKPVANITINEPGKFIGNGSGLEKLNANKITDGILGGTRGGTGIDTITANHLLFGGSGNTITQNANLTWTSSSVLNITGSIGIGIGANTMQGKLHIYEASGTDASSTAGTLCLDHGNSNGVSSILFKSPIPANLDYGYIKYIDNVASPSTYSLSNIFNVGAISHAGMLVIGCERNTNDSVLINPTGNIALVPKGTGVTYIKGNVGIGSTNPTVALDVNGNIDCSGGIAINGSTAFFATGGIDAGNLSNTYLNFKYNGTNNDWCYIRQIGGDNSYKLALDFHDDSDDARFCIRSIESTATVDKINEVFTVNNGHVNCSNSLSINNIQIYNYLFNNTGLSQSAITSFDVNTFGYKYIYGGPSGDSPGTHAEGLNQYYTWYIGMGNEYSASGAGSQGVQFALPRNRLNPTLSVRFKENSNWQSWVAITAGNASTSSSCTGNAAGLSGTPSVSLANLNTNGVSYIGTVVSDRSSFNHSSSPLTVTNQLPTPDLFIAPVLHLCRQGKSGVAYGSRATFYLGRYETVSTHARTALYLSLTYDDYQDSITMVFRSNGHVGILILFPEYPLHVGTTNATSSVPYGSLYATDYGMFTSTRNNLITSIKAEGAIWTVSSLVYSSDERIKTNINDISDDLALQQILSIQPKTYNYIDNIARGINKVYGFIAQQIAEVIPHAVTSNNREYIPNIYKSFNLTSDIINTTENLTSLLKIDDNIKIYTDQLNSFELCKIIEITETSIKIDKSLKGKTAFIYGTQVNDFHVLNKEYIYTLNVCATQELHRLIQKQQEQINNMNIIIQQQQEQINEIKQLLQK